MSTDQSKGTILFQTKAVSEMANCSSQPVGSTREMLQLRVTLMDNIIYKLSQGVVCHIYA